jgi:hypothetical protein
MAIRPGRQTERKTEPRIGPHDAMLIDEVLLAVLAHALRTLSFNPPFRNSAGCMTSRDAGREGNKVNRPLAPTAGSLDLPSTRPQKLPIPSEKASESVAAVDGTEVAKLLLGSLTQARRIASKVLCR